MTPTDQDHPSSSSPPVTTIILIGLRGSGKSTIGRLLAERLNNGCQFIDLDDLVLVSFKESTVREVWSQHGQDLWRETECRIAIEQLESSDHQEPRRIIALGGGTPMIPAVRKRLLELKTDSSIRIIYLRGEPGILFDRLDDETDDRPALTDWPDLKREITTVFELRDPTYLTLGDHIIELSRDEAIDETIRRTMISVYG